jgi:hypothetical protein
VSPDTEQAIRMLDSFGARYFELTVNDLKGRKDGYRHHTAPGGLMFESALSTGWRLPR